MRTMYSHSTLPIFLLPLLLSVQVHSYMFYMESLGTKLSYATKGDVIIYNAHISISADGPLSFHVSLPSDILDEPIFNVEEMKIIGLGTNIKVEKMEYTYSKKSTDRPHTERSQATINFGNTITKTESTTDNDIVIQVKARILDNNFVANDDEYWLYFGVDYQDNAVWVIGKSVRIQLVTGPARITAAIINDNFPMSTATKLEFVVDIRHTSETLSKASGLKVVLTIPTGITFDSMVPNVGVITTSTNEVKIENLGQLPTGQQLGLKLYFTIDVQTEKGKVIYNHIDGVVTFSTTNEESCALNLEERFMKTVKFYSQKDTCDNDIDLATVQLTASSKHGSNGPEQLKNPHTVSNPGWVPWGNSSIRLADDFLQVKFNGLAEISRIKLLAREKKFVKKYQLAYSDDGVFWKNIMDKGVVKEFETTLTGDYGIHLDVFQQPIIALFIRIHVTEGASFGTSLLASFMGCVDPASTPPSSGLYQRGFIAAADLIVVCDVDPDRRKTTPSCYMNKVGVDNAYQAIDPRVINVLGYDTATSKLYGLGLTSFNQPVHMEISGPRNVVVIPEPTWTTIQSSAQLPTIVPQEPVTENRLAVITGTAVTVTDITTQYYAASAVGLLKGAFVPTGQGHQLRYQLLVSWTKYFLE